MTPYNPGAPHMTPVKCEARACRNPATHVYIWRSDIMKAPAFWYGCEREANDWLRLGRRAGMIEAKVEAVYPATGCPHAGCLVGGKAHNHPTGLPEEPTP